MLHAYSLAHALPNTGSHTPLSFLRNRYYDSPDGSTYCRFYLPTAIKIEGGPEPTGLPHIAVVDPITAAVVKTWTGFKDAERLMDKLMEYADDPPKDTLAELNAQQPHFSQQLSPPKSNAPAAAASQGGMQSHFAQPDFGAFGGGGRTGDADEEAALAAAIAASLEGGGGGGGGGGGDVAMPPPPPVPESAPAGPSDAEIDEMWGPMDMVDEPADGIMLKIRLPNGSQCTKKFGKGQTLKDILKAVHYTEVRLDPTKAYKLSMNYGPQVTDYEATLEAAGIQRGAYVLAEV